MIIGKVSIQFSSDIFNLSAHSNFSNFFVRQMTGQYENNFIIFVYLLLLLLLWLLLLLLLLWLSFSN